MCAFLRELLAAGACDGSCCAFVAPCRRTLGALAEKCHAYAKALHYKELEFQESSHTAVEALISINNQLRQPDAAVGILNVAQKELHMELKESWCARGRLGVVAGCHASFDPGSRAHAPSPPRRAGTRSCSAGTTRSGPTSASSSPLPLAVLRTWTRCWVSAAAWPRWPSGTNSSTCAARSGCGWSRMCGGRWRPSPRMPRGSWASGRQCASTWMW